MTIVSIGRVAEIGVKFTTTLPSPPDNPFIDPAALQESQVTEVLVDAIHQRMTVVLELRTSLQFDESNTGVLIAYGLRQFVWTVPDRGTHRTAWTVGRMNARPANDQYSARVELWPDPGAHFEFAAAYAVFLAGNVPGLPDAPPDYGTTSADDLHAQVPRCHSSFLPHYAASVRAG